MCIGKNGGYIDIVESKICEVSINVNVVCVGQFTQ
jgi:hypothetical protein